MRPGSEASRQVTLKDVARLAQVSYQTVSKVINGRVHVLPETERRIWEAVRALGYAPNVNARSLRSRQSRLIGYSWRLPPPDEYSPVLEKFVQSILEAAEKAGFHVLLFPCPAHRGQVEVYRTLIHTNRVDGFLLSSTDLDDERIRFLREMGFPFVAFGRSNPDWDFCWVDVDGTAGVRMACQHLIERGHRRIGVITWPDLSLSGSARLQGYLEAMEAAGIAPRSAWIARAPHSAEGGRRAAEQLLELPPAWRPTAIVAVSDLMAIGAMKAVRERGLEVGQDVAIVGFDDAPMVQHLQPPLTSVRQPIWEAGQHAVRMLIQLIRGERPEPRQLLLLPQLVVRASSAGGRAAAQEGR